MQGTDFLDAKSNWYFDLCILLYDSFLFPCPPQVELVSLALVLFCNIWKF